ncbi:OmpA family protein [Aliiroseovarius crassostreae]|nr:OmpA family protein [Aliiroseovarius crassostreae]UWP90523.1 OmpA family protein [Aliiroseovarius crassostreae]UWQ02077.1 OmpA family protein [Aliiroseovarius crassostreae]
MRLAPSFLAPGLFAAAALLSLVGARVAVSTIETLSAEGVRDEFLLQGFEWAEVEADGLEVVVSGIAPDEVTRLRAVSAAGTVIDSGRVIDNMQVAATEDIAPPRFSLEILRNDAGISLIGLIPASSDRDRLKERIKAIAGRTHVTDLMGTADYTTPANWDEVLDFAVTALETLPRAKISMDAKRVSITAVSDSAKQKAGWERELKREAPRNLLLLMDISAPRPVITPFTLRFLIEEGTPRFDACSAHDQIGRAKIAAAAAQAGIEGAIDCTIGLGVPSPDWSDAVNAGIQAVSKFGGGSVTFSDADVTLVAPAGTKQAVFDRVVGELEADLPQLYSLHSILPEIVKIDGSGDGEDGPPEFVATLSPEGLVQLRGRMTDDLQRAAAESYAKAAFGVTRVYEATRLDPDLPEGWPIRVLAGLEVLGHLANGSVVVQPDVVDVRGNTGDPEASATISRILAEKLGASQNYQINVTYQEKLDPQLGLPSPQECVAAINGFLTDSKISFAPGSANIEASAGDTLDKIAEQLRGCEDVRMEIAGYTDSQGREEMNRALSQSRAQAVLTALLGRRVLTSNLSAKGYGEDDPIADNGTEEGREANRRIEFHLLDLPSDEAGAESSEAVADPDTPTSEAAPTDEAAPAVPSSPDDATPTGSGEASTEDTDPSDPAAETDAQPDEAEVQDRSDAGQAEDQQTAPAASDFAGPATLVQTPGTEDPRPAPRPDTVDPADAASQ